MPSNRTWLALAAVAATLSLGPGPTLAAPRADEPPPERPLYDLNTLEPWPGSQPGGGGESLAATNPTSLVPTMQIAFQSYRDGNWEIYMTSADGSTHQRLTNNGAVDVNPRLNRGNTRIVFASDRDGQAEIYAMNADGTGQSRLTWTGSIDAEPAWSPDGSKIVFTSLRDGKAEIYVMNADGGGQTRLTYAGEYNASPAWSPDGSQIAFVSYRNGGYRIWTMNADGSHQVQRSSQPYSNHPAWYPSGEYITYDADGNGDGWQEIWAMAVDGSSQGLAYDPPDNQTDAWVSGWSPDERYLLFTRISFVNFQGNWYWTAAYLDAYDRTNGQVTRVVDSSVDWNGDWRASDTQPPTTYVKPLPPLTRHAVLELVGTDAGGAGVATFDAERRTGTNGEWLWLATGITGTTFDLGAMPGGLVIYFRVRARDHVGNVEPWPDNPNTFTRFYSYEWHLTVRDNAGAPVVGALLTGTPAFGYTATTDAGGEVLGLAVNNLQTQVYGVSKAGYGPLPNTSDTRFADLTRLVYLPPTDNIIPDWSFESGSLGGWQAGGTLPPKVVSSVMATGVNAVQLGEPTEWGSYQPAAPVDRVATLSRTVSLPLTMTSPVLSFIYELAPTPYHSDPPPTFFSLAASDGVQQTTLFSQTVVPISRTQKVIDLSPWAGQAITLTFELTLPAYTYPTAQLDDISIGQGRPDVFVTSNAPTVALPGQTYRYDLSYGNQSVITSTNVILTYTLAAGLQLIGSEPPPASLSPLTWNLGTQPGHSGPFTIAITTTVAPTATRGVEVPLLAQIVGTPELETLNNTSQLMLWIGHRLFLPVIHR